jgi:hypothetical protein
MHLPPVERSAEPGAHRLAIDMIESLGDPAVFGEKMFDRHSAISSCSNWPAAGSSKPLIRASIRRSCRRFAKIVPSALL